MSRHPMCGIAVLLLFAVSVMPSRAQSDTGPAPPIASENASTTPSTQPPAEPAAAQTGAVSPPSAVAAEPPAKSAAPKRPKPARTRPAAPAVDKPAPLPSIQGRLELVAGQKQTVAAGEVMEGLVYFLPKAGNPKPKPGYFTVITHSKGFSPSLLVVPAGSTLAFPNRDSVLHNVFSRTPGATFDFGNYGPGQSRQQVFSKPGLVIVNCSVHHSMRATVVVMATPYYTRPDKNGRFELTGLPSGTGTVVYWHPRAAATTVQITLPGAAAQKQRLVASKPRSDHDGMK